MTNFYRNRPIKFRGVDAAGKSHYGDVWQRNDGTVLFDWDAHVWIRISPDSVAQLVGYDADGNEVYEGDTMLDENGKEFSVELGERGRRTDSCVFFDVDTNHYHLKEVAL